MAFDSQGRILLTSRYGATRLTPNGILDTTFGDNGLAQPFPDFIDAATQGEMLIGNTMIAPLGGRQFVRLDDNGHYDAAFGEPVVNPTFRDDTEPYFLYSGEVIPLRAQTATAQPDGSVLVSWRLPDGTFKEVRIEGDGSTPGPVTGAHDFVSIVGTAGNDNILAGIGTGDFVDATLNGVGRRFKVDDNVIYHADGNAGNDYVQIFSSRKGGSTITGGDGNDVLVGGRGNDSLSGNAGNDTLNGMDGDDRLAGNGGRDRLDGNLDNDRLFGGAAGDWLFADHGTDQLDGGGGNDRLFADDSNLFGDELDTLHGGAGDDTFVTKDGVVDQVFGDGGTDTATADSVDVLTSIEVLL
jgi:Ca2+-binding RTX toxin-like protein